MVVFFAYGCVWVWQTSFLVEGERYFCLSDDQMVSMRYAKNLVNTGVLTWNPGGEKVEGISNLLWTLLMAFFHLFPFPASKVSLAVQLAGLSFLTANLLLVHRIFEEITGGPRSAALVPVVLTAGYYPLNYWSLMGFEVSAVIALFNLAVLLQVRAVTRATPDLRTSLVLAILCLIRMDMAVLSLATVVAFALFFPGRDRTTCLTVGAGSIAAAVLGQSLFRSVYYGDWLPNTYYLKMTGYPVLLRITRGCYALLRFVVPFPAILCAASAAAALAKRDRVRVALLALVATQFTYSAYVGGDAWEWWGIANRFVVVVMPILFVVFSASTIEGWRRVDARYGRRLPAASSFLAAVFLCLAVLAGINARGKTETAADWLTLKAPFDEVRETRTKVELGRALEAAVPPNASIALYWAGTIPYFSGHRYIDILGKSDRVIARGPMHRFEAMPDFFRYNNFLGNKYTFFYPGHLKWDYTHSIGKLRPDVILQLWSADRAVIPFLRDYRTGLVNDQRVYVRR